VAAVDAGDEDHFHEVFEQMLEESDVILPPPDLLSIEAAAEFSGEGLIPD
jgi:hypothetical protein